MMTLPDIVELERFAAPAPEPQALACDGELLWVSSRLTHRIYAVDPRNGAARDEAAAPGTPWGMTVTGDELRVVCGEPPDDNRFIRRLVPGHGFSADRIACPDDTGSYLGFDGDRLYLTQWYRRRILSIDAQGVVGSSIDVPHQICGCVVIEGRFYLATTDDETTTDYWLTRVDARGGGGPVVTDLARIPFAARSLAFDGDRFWTNHRESNEVVAFEAPPEL